MTEFFGTWHLLWLLLVPLFLLILLRRWHYFSTLKTPERLACGYTIILPGIEGASLANSNLAQGLADGGLDTAIEVDDWTTGYLVGYLVHLRYLTRNRRQAQRIADKIVAYQDEFPGRPVNLVGHSGGAGIALLALEALPPGRSVSSVLLLAPAVSPAFDLSTALARAERGIWNFWSPLDVFFLVIGTVAAGTIDGRHTIAAGACGFARSTGNDPTADSACANRLHEIKYARGMMRSGSLGGHFGCVGRRFSRDYLAPLLKATEC